MLFSRFGFALRAKRRILQRSRLLVLLLAAVAWMAGAPAQMPPAHSPFQHGPLDQSAIPGAWTAGPRQVRIVEHSTLHIHGSTNVNRFTCTYRPVGETVPVVWTPHSTAEGTERATGMQATLAVPTDCFDCGNRKMNADFKEALQAEAHPHVRITVQSATWQPSTEDLLPVTAETHISIAGVTRKISLEAEWHRCPDGCLQATASTEMAMSDFGIERPTALLGMVRTDDAITIELDLHVKLDSASARR